MKQIWLVDILFKGEVLDTQVVEIPVCSGSENFLGLLNSLNNPKERK